ncbi:MAG: amidohydrolase [Pseudanabaenaceae cyanobacterium SKYGB_i_bin29]|nr:amidohydrolase [Pseudanabaenaceae cyanobacterium SKYG29]MDW8420905.1 amidohydrolase [Pseudanabaenaceae cyanobacterium SKYGB_i_bin29]
MVGVRPEIRQLQSSLIRWRRHFHRFPELGFKEKQTSAFIQSHLREWGIPYEVLLDTGVVATISDGSGGKVLAIRADMDALPIQELNMVEYRSQIDGLMHACGHDGHTAIALGTAYYLWQHRQELKGTVKVIFQPAEEGPGGAKPMITAGVLANPKVDGILGLHIWNNLPLGTIGLKQGALMAAVDIFHCTITGKGGHGAIPQQTIDAVVVAAQVVSALQTIVSRNIDPLDSAVVTIGKLQAGTAPNVIAQEAHLSGTVRYFSPRVGDVIYQRIEQILQGICASYGASYTLDYQKCYPPVVNHPAMTELVRSVVQETIDLEVVPNCATLAAEDMSFFLQEVPGCFFFLGSANPAKGLHYPHHHPRFDFDETVLGTGVEIFVRCAERFLGYAPAN